jgi:hypothetical protein
MWRSQGGVYDVSAYVSEECVNSETSVDFFHTTQSRIPPDSTLYPKVYGR